MIDVKELRIGNWITFASAPNKFERVEDIQTHDQHPAINRVDLADDVRPIPLTPEILEKAGFKEYKDIKNNQHANNGLAYFFGHADYRYVLKRMWHKEPNYSVCIEYTDSPFIQDKDRQYVFTFDVKYLHQLQNLFYALTQTELNIQL